METSKIITLRTAECNKIKNQIRLINKSIQITEVNTVKYFSKIETCEYSRDQHAKLLENSITLKDEVAMLECKITNINNGNEDTNLTESARIVKRDIDQKETIAVKKKHDKKTFDDAQSKKSMNFYKEQNKNGKCDPREMKKSYEYFQKLCASIPDYMRENLANMPNNKGFIWKGVSCYGDLPAEPDKPRVLTEKLYGGILRIYETDENYHRVYEKDGKNPRKLIQTTPRRRFKNLM